MLCLLLKALVAMAAVGAVLEAVEDNDPMDKLIKKILAEEIS